MAAKNRTGKAFSESQGIANPMSPRLLTLKGAAEYLGLTVWAMRERIWAGQIPVVQFPGGRKQYVDVRDLNQFIEAHKRVIAWSAMKDQHPLRRFVHIAFDARGETVTGIISPSKGFGNAETKHATFILSGLGRTLLSEVAPASLQGRKKKS
jgi:hypothetical protein